MNNPLVLLLLGLLIIWVGSYFYSCQRNRRALRLLANWLKEALPILGARQSSRWQGADRLDVFVTEGRGNIREAAIVLGMQSRQLFKLIISLVRRGRDSMTTLVSLTRATAAGNEFEIFETAGIIPRVVLAASDTEQPWQTEDFARNNAYRIAFRSDNAREMARRVLTLLLDEGFEVRRLSVRPNAPHFMLVLNLRKMPQVEATGLLRLLRTLADEVAQSPEKSFKRPEKSLKNSKRKNPQSSEIRLPADTGSAADGYLPTAQHSKNGHAHPETK